MPAVKPKKHSRPSRPPPALRERAEAALRATRTDVGRMPPEKVQRLMHELQVHQIELEMQNEELRGAQAALAQSRDRFQDLYDFSPIGYLTLDQDGTIVEANLTVATMLGVERVRLVGRKFTRFVARPAQDTFYLHQRAALGCETKEACDIVLRPANGTTFAARMETICLREPNSRACHSRSAIIDISERKRAEDALAISHLELERRVIERTADLTRANEALRASAAAIHEREQRLRAILNTVGDAIVTADRSGTITGVNPAAGRMFGYSEAEMIGQSVGMLMPSPFREEYRQYLKNYEHTDGARTIGLDRPIYARRKGDTAFPIDLTVNEVDGQHQFIAVIRDITERKRLESEVLRITEEERMHVSAELHDGVCQEMVGISFLANSLGRDLARSGHPLAPQACRIGEAILNATEHARMLARGMSPVVTDGHGLMHALSQLTNSTARMYGIVCKFLCPVPVSIENPTQANQLYRIAQEAIRNAHQHGRARRITVRLKEAAGQVCLTVTDNGSGMPAALLHGPGMGVRVMRYRAGLIGGQLRVQSRGRGGTDVLCHVAKIPAPV